jgi:hypothetical protein
MIGGVIGGTIGFVIGGLFYKMAAFIVNLNYRKIS